MSIITEIFEKNGLKINKTQEMQFKNFYKHLVSENEKYNLTAITELEDVALKHFVDSVLPQNAIKKNASVVDVGSGAGFPAIPLKIVRPDLSICMVDSLNKRVNFLNECVKILNFDKTNAIHSRAEDFAKKNREKFDVAVARAVAPLNTLVEYLLPLVKVGGQVIVYKSSKLDEELPLAKNAIKILGGKLQKIEDFTLFSLDNEQFSRKILIISKISSTPTKYPRSSNKPKTDPIR